MRKIYTVAIALITTVTLNAQTALNADELFYAQHSEKILQLFNEECPVLELGDGEGLIFQYGLVDFDGDGINELWVREIIGENGAFFCRGGNKLEIIAATWFKSFASVNGNVLCASGPAGTGAFYTSYYVIENSTIAHQATHLMMYSLKGKKEHECEYDGNVVTWKWFNNNYEKKFAKGLVPPQNDEWFPFERLSETDKK